MLTRPWKQVNSYAYNPFHLRTLPLLFGPQRLTLEGKALGEGLAIRARSCGISDIFQGYRRKLCAAAVCLAAASFAAAPPGAIAAQRPAARSANRTATHAAPRAPARKPAAPQAATPKKKPTPESARAARERELETLSRELREPNRRVANRAYTRLAALSRHWPAVERSRAALPLGYYEYQGKRYTQARVWFHLAQGDPVLSQYGLYWEGLAADAAGQDADAMALLEKFRNDYPGSVMDKPALEAFADAALDGKAADRALAALRGYPDLISSPELLVRLALAEEQSGDLTAAALDFQRVYDLFPLNSAAQNAIKGIARLHASLGDKFPPAPLADRIARAETLYQNGRWKDAKTSWAALSDSLTGIDHERAALRAAQCESRLTGNGNALEALTLTDPGLDAERWISLFRVYRAANDEDKMKSVVDKVRQLSSAGAPAEMADRALLLMGDYYWANLKRDQAVEYYQRLAKRQADGPSAATAEWRIAWTAYLERDPNAGTLLQSQIERFPDSPYIPDALYWLGRLAERDGNPSLARAYYNKVSSRFAQSYFGRLAARRAAQISAKAEPAASLPLLALIPPLQPMQPLEDDIPADVNAPYKRAVALRSIAFDDSATLEFRDAYRTSQAPQLLIDAARAAQDAKHYLTGAALVRQLVPDLESRPMDSVPESIWRIVYPLPQRSLIDFYASHHHFDPMLYAALIRQESGFQPDALSSAGAVGLAQLEPYTARKWSRILHLRYSYRRLSDPRYNLRVSSAYFQSLIGMFGSVEAAVAAYNAGENRAAAWIATQHYEDPAEFVESIPFSQTRHYVEVVLSGAAIYRRLYGNPQ
jgi:peptidoglycan lytic transglycosylase